MAAQDPLRSPAAPPWRALERALALLVVAAVLAAYANSLEAPLVFDDSLLSERAEVHATSLHPAELVRAAQGFPLQRWLAYVTFAANHAIHGLRPAGYHAVNVAIHAAASVLVLLLAARLFERLNLGDPDRRRDAAVIAALLFALHPVQTMAVTYVIQRMTSLGTLFALGALLCWLRARTAGGLRPAPTVAALALWFLAFSCKENFLALPAVVLVVELATGLDPRALVARRPALWTGIALALAGLAAAALVAYLPVIAAEQRREYGIPISTRLLTQPRVIWHYLSLLAAPLPGRLHVDYAWPASTGLLTPASTLPALVGLAGLAGAAIAARRRLPLLFLAVGWLLAALLVEQTILPIDFVFEHRLYFAAAGAWVAAGWLLTSPRLGATTAARRWALALPVLLALGWGTHLRNEDWRDPTRLFADPESTAVGRARSLLNGAVAARRQGRLDEAERLFLQAIALEPALPQPYANLGNLAAQRGRSAEAERWYREALARDPTNAEVLYNLGVLLAGERRFEEAMTAYRRAISARPSHADARVNLALLVAEVRGDRHGAIQMLGEALARDPGATGALLNRALFLADEGALDAALADARDARRLLGEDANAHYVLGYVHRAAGRAAEASREATAALRLDPSHRDALELRDHPARRGAPGGR